MLVNPFKLKLWSSHFFLISSVNNNKKKKVTSPVCNIQAKAERKKIIKAILNTS